jgi:hypothetical protein
VAENPFPWMSEAMDLKKEKNFFETRVIEYQRRLTQLGLASGSTSGESKERFPLGQPPPHLRHRWSVQLLFASNVKETDFVSLGLSVTL